MELTLLLKKSRCKRVTRSGDLAKNGVNLKDLKEWNQLSSDLIIEGEKLTISSVETTTSGQYTVKQGDSLWKIAQKFGTSVGNLKSLNNLQSDIIYAGTTLNVKGQAQAAQPAQEASQPQTEQNQLPRQNSRNKKLSKTSSLNKNLFKNNNLNKKRRLSKQNSSLFNQIQTNKSLKAADNDCNCLLC